MADLPPITQIKFTQEKFARQGQTHITNLALIESTFSISHSKVQQCVFNKKSETERSMHFYIALANRPWLMTT